jgi:sulfatase modifying factor 1
VVIPAINSVLWWESYAFCIWDGGFLPSDAEWEYAAVGGSQQRVYPWGATAPGMDNEYAIYGCYYPSGSATCAGLANIAPVGTATLGAGAWGQLDMAGTECEHTLDWYLAYVSPCTNCAKLSGGSYRIFRGGSFLSPSLTSLTSQREQDVLENAGDVDGFRCARAP